MPEDRDTLQKEIASLRSENHRLRKLVLDSETSSASLEDAERWLHTAMRGGNMWLWRWDVIQDKTFWSPTAYEILSTPSLPFDGTIPSFYARVHPEDRAYIYTTLSQSVASGEDCSFFYRVVLPEEPMRWMECRSRAYRDEAGNVIGLMGTTRDVTSQRYIEEAILQVAASVNATPHSDFCAKIVQQVAEILGADMVLIGKMKDASAKMITSVAYYADGALQSSIIYPLTGTPCERVFGKEMCLFLTGVTERFPEDAFLQKERIDGYAGVPLCASDGTPIGLLNALWRRPIPNPELVSSILRLFSSRVVKELEQCLLNEQIEAQEGDLQRQTRLLRETQKAAAIGGWEFDPQTLAVYWTDQMFAVYAVEPQTFVPTYESVLGHHTPESRRRVEEAIQYTLSTGNAFEIETVIRTPQNQQKWLKTVGEVQVDKTGYTRVYGACRDITAEREAAQELQVSRANLLALIDSRPDLIISLDRNYCILIVNAATQKSFQDVFGTFPEKGLPMYDFLPRELWNLWKPRYDRALAGETFQVNEVIEMPTHSLNTEVFFHPIRKEGEVTGIAVFSRDVTQQVKLQEELQQSLKMEGLGRLAGGIAHDFNNILTAIIGYVDLIQESIPLESRLHHYTQQVMHASEKASSLTSQLLAFARKQLIQPQLVSLNKTLQQTMILLQHLLGEDVALALHLDASEDVVRIDPGQAEQILVNLAINARDAMPLGGNLTIRTQNRGEEEIEMPPPHLLKAKSYFVLSVEDTGVGMSEAVQSRIFEPFFTTKPAGKGTGLGLSMCYGVVQQAGGTIRVESEEGRGTAFHLYLPCSEEKAPLLTTVPYVASKRGGETILLVEDEALVRQMTAEVLQAHGYRLLVASSAEEALQIAAPHDLKIDLLLTDVVMPQMSGKQVADRITPLHPEMRVLYMSGYTEDAIVHHQVLKEGVVLLPKPFTPSILTHKVREVLDRA